VAKAPGRNAPDGEGRKPGELTGLDTRVGTCRGFYINLYTLYFGFVVGVIEMRCEEPYLLGRFLGDGWFEKRGIAIATWNKGLFILK